MDTFVSVRAARLPGGRDPSRWWTLRRPVRVPWPRVCAGRSGVIPAVPWFAMSSLLSAVPGVAAALTW